MKISRSILILPAVLLTAAPAMAQGTEPNAPVAAHNAPPESFGAGTAALQIPIAEFGARNGASSWTYASAGYVSRAAGSDLLWAPVTLPNGAVLEMVEAFFNDSGAATGRVFLTRFFGANSIEDIGNAATAGTPGFTTISFTPNRTVDNTNDIYVIYLDMPVDASLSSKGVRIRYRLQVSPAPATATFADVPVGHPLFRFVEAMVASGVTGGCGGGNYCPNTPITRGEMAVFMSVALGLHWGF